MDELLKAGLTLEKVYSGLRDQRWSLIDEEGWIPEPDNGEEYDCCDYFPDWKGGVSNDGDDIWVLTDPLYPFAAHSRRDNDNIL